MPRAFIRLALQRRHTTMAAGGYDEADTRAKLIDPALHQALWVEHVPPEQRGTHGEIHREQAGQRIAFLDGSCSCST